MPMSPLEKLPRDCWMDVMRFLPSRDLASLTKTSRGLRTSTEPSLYRSISMDWVRAPLVRVLNLLRTIHHRPDLAAYTQHLSLVSSEMKGFGGEEALWEAPIIADDWQQESSRFQDVVEYAVDVVELARFPSLTKWTDALKDGDPYAYGAILLSQLPKLRTLRLDYSFIWQSGFPGLMLKHALFSAPEGTLPRFTDLQVADYGSNAPPAEPFDMDDALSAHGFPPCDPDQFIAWLYLPSLRSLEIWLRSLKGLDTSLLGRQGDEAWNLGNLHSLVLARSTIGEEPVRKLLSHTRSLRSLHVGLGYYPRENLPNVPGRKTLIQSFESSGQQLESVSLELELYPGDTRVKVDTEEEEENQRPLAGFLTMFPSLRAVEVPVWALIGYYADDLHDLADVLPAGLESLCLREDLFRYGDYEMNERRMIDCVQRFVPRCASATPYLQRIHLRIWENDRGIHRARREKTRSMCEEVGIHFEVSRDRFPPGLWTGTSQLGGS